MDTCRISFLGRSLFLFLLVSFLFPFGRAQDIGICPEEDGRDSILIKGEISAGEEFSKPFGKGMLFALSPVEKGWLIRVYDNKDPGFDISRLTIPLRWGNPRSINGWHFRNAYNTGPNDGSVNWPQERREFIFSPDVRTIFEQGRERNVGMDEIKKIEQYGRGELYIEDYRLSDLEEGMQARMVYMKFRVCLSWPVD